MSRAFSILLIAALTPVTGCKDGRGSHQSSARTSTSYSEPQLQRAAMEGNLSLVKACLDAGIDANGGRASADGAATPLSLAALGAHPSVVSALLDAGADPNKPTDARGSTPLIVAASKGDAASLRLLIKAGASVNAADRDGFTALMSAAVGNSAACIRALIDAGANVHSTTSDKCEWPSCTAFVIAMGKADLLAIQELIEGGAVMPNKATVLHWAVGFQREDLVQALLENGANVNARDAVGRTPLFYDQSDDMKVVEVGGRTQFEHTQATMTKLLLAAGADPNVQDDHGETVLHKESITVHQDRVRRLIAAGADPTIKQKDGYTAAQIFQELRKKLPHHDPPTKVDAHTWAQAGDYAYETQLALLEGRDAVAAGEAVLRRGVPPRTPELIVKGILSSGDGAKAIVGYPASRWSLKTVQVGDVVESFGANWEVVKIDTTRQSVMLTHRESGASHVIATAR